MIKTPGCPVLLDQRVNVKQVSTHCFQRGLALVLLVACPAWAAPQAGDVASPIQGIKQGSRLEVMLTSGEKISGRLGPVSPDSFEVRRSRRPPRQVAFGDVQSVKKGLGTGAKVAIIAGAVVVACAIVIAVAIHDVGASLGH